MTPTDSTRLVYQRNPDVKNSRSAHDTKQNVLLTPLHSFVTMSRSFKEEHPLGRYRVWLYVGARLEKKVGAQRLRNSLRFSRTPSTSRMERENSRQRKFQFLGAIINQNSANNSPRYLSFHQTHQFLSKSWVHEWID